VRKVFLFNIPIVEWCYVLSEQARIAQLQEQMNKIKAALKRQSPFIVFLTHILGGMALGFGSYYGQPWMTVGLGIFCFCTTISTHSALIIKEEYNELQEQMDKISSSN
jgi:hypothetical protein